MSSFFSVSALALTAVLVGCASTEQVASSDDKPQNCRQETRVGSNIPVRDCRAAMTDEERARMIEQARNAARTVVPTKPGAGG